MVKKFGISWLMSTKKIAPILWSHHLFVNILGHKKTLGKKIFVVKIFWPKILSLKPRKIVAQTNVKRTVVICLRWSQKPNFEFWPSNIWQMSPGQISLWQLSIVKEEPWRIPLQFGQYWMSNSNRKCWHWVCSGGWWWVV